ncbi:hypothetical protein KVR01_000103 [Diaporthe batatas]|uniref:uncharacterized protein n=1 Tax=Diaporthe batatas TaxID=748121 RepID=UPI001D036D97|nr:uncharacterized protein KVR01_000103 [Diaporthe batatas]KAG8169358.1 hypothetical protein KVR01_000103 [Diaporthe batatas]
MSDHSPLQASLPIRPRGEARGKARPKKEKDIAASWDNYFGKNDNDLAKWKLLCCDLGKQAEEFTSKTQCRKALKHVWVNLHDFLAAENKPEDVVFFSSERALAAYTRETRKFFPRHNISRGSPLRDLLARIVCPRGHKYQGQA